jgi:putative colanic acid biosynthesis UDP-glucose lipid carrier transferase
MQQGFFQKYSSAIEKSHRILDLLLILVSAYIAHFIRFGSFAMSAEILNALLLTLILSLIVFKRTPLYQTRRGQTFLQEAFHLLLSWGLVLTSLTVLAYLSKTGQAISREWALLTAVISFGLMLVARIILRFTLMLMRRKGHNSRNAVIYGAGKLGEQIARTFNKQAWSGVKVAGYYDDMPSTEAVAGLPVLGNLDDLERTIENGRQNKPDTLKIDQVWITLPLSARDRIHEIIMRLQNTPVQLQFVPDSAVADLMQYPADRFVGINILNVSAPKIVGPEAFLKNAFDKIFSILVLLLVWPIMAFVALFIKLESKGPIIFKQRRYGIDGREIEVWKFRSMTVCEDGDNVLQVKKDDVRLTRTGTFIRKWSVDELPQFLNVLQGTMSVVGPRPHPVAHNEYYREHIQSYMGRHIVKPGITGWAQVNGWRGETDTPDKMEQRVRYDLEYISNWNLWLDIKIVFLTIFRGFKGENAY